MKFISPLTVAGAISVLFSCQFCLAQRDPMMPVPGLQPANQQPQDVQPQSTEEKTELDLPSDESIQVHVEPVVHGSVVDRVNDTATVFVTAPPAASVRVFLVPVDSPYGGKALARPRLLGTAVKSGRQFAFKWSGKEPDEYVKVFAVVRNPGQGDVRSTAVDLAIGSARLRTNAPAPTP